MGPQLMGADRVHLFPAQHAKTPYWQREIVRWRMSTRKAGNCYKSDFSFLGASICQHTGCLRAVPLFILYPQIAHLSTHSCNLCLSSPYEVSVFWSGKIQPHFICVNTTQRNRADLPKHGVPFLPGTERWVKKTDKVSALRSLHAFPFKNPCTVKFFIHFPFCK